VSDTEATPKGFMSRMGDDLRADAKADEGLGKQVLSDLLEKVEALEKRIAKLEHGS
jgi:archaellum component FlaC